MPEIREEYWVSLQGKRHPTYPGVLVAAHENGLLGIEVSVVQYPDASNGNTAVCEATVTMRGPDDRELVYREVGDANAGNVGPRIAPHIIRMAATRAKGRALRDALALGIALVEELGPDTDPEPAPPKATKAPAKAHQPPVQPALAQSEALHPKCSWKGCKQPLSEPELAASMDFAARPLCPVHLQQAQALPRCSAAGCKVVINPSTADQTHARFGQVLCARHAAEAAEKADTL